MILDIFPQPTLVNIVGGNSDFSLKKYVHCPSVFSERLRMRIIEFVQEQNKKTGNQLNASFTPSANDFVTINHKEDLAKQGYELIIEEDGVNIYASDESGAFYALETLSQLIDQFGLRLPRLKINDSPDFPNRGYMLDISRSKIPKLDELKKLIRRLARLKINQLQLYMENAFAYSEHQKVWKDVSPLTAMEIAELDIFCSDYYIELVPNQNSFGHMERWLRHDSYRHLAETPDGFISHKKIKTDYGMVLRPNGETLKFLDGLYRELLPCFRSGFFNVGCDETFELGQGFSKAACEKSGKGRVYLDFLLKIHSLVSKHQKKMMFWGDIILTRPELIPELPRDLIAMNWGYEADHPYNEECPKFAEAGIEFYVCPGTSSWNCLTGKTSNCIGNMRNAAENGFKNGASGYLITDWGDNGNHQYPPISYLGILAGACLSWSHCEWSDDMLIKGIDRVFGGQENSGLGRWLYDFGRIIEGVKGKNNTKEIFHRMLSWNEHLSHKYLEGVKSDSLQQSINKFDDLLCEIPLLRLSESDGSLIKAELRGNLLMARLGAQIGLAHLTNTRKENMEKHITDIEEVISAHRELWLTRNRIGGLERSLELFFKSIDFIKK